MLDMQVLSGEVVSALAILTQSEFAVLHAVGQFLDGDGHHYKLSPEDFQRVLNHDTLIHPITEIEVAQASHKVWPVFEIDTDVLGTREQ
jgi:hypothetical protein